MNNPVLRTLWNAVALAAVAFLAWTGYTSINDRQNAAAAQPVVTINVGQALLQGIKRVNKQVFIEHHNAVPITYEEAPQSWLNIAQKAGIKQRFVVIVRGKVSAGFDLSKLSEGDIWVSEDHRRAQITLPPPTIFEQDVVIDDEQTETILEQDFCPGFFCKGDVEAYKNDIIPEAKKQLVIFAQESDILRQAAQEGEAYFENLLNALDIAEVRVVIPGYSSE